MKGSPINQLAPIEKEVIRQVRALRTSPHGTLEASLLKDPAALAHRFILGSHGNVQLRLSVISRELGVEVRTLQRMFVARYQRTMAQFQIETRLTFSKSSLRLFPPTKVSVVAESLGYAEVRDFNRFFKKHMHESPAAWGLRERDRIAASSKLPADR